MTAVVLVIVGIALLIAGGSALVKGASEVATKFGVSPMVVGLTVVGFGTSAPELVVNVVGALDGATDLAFGNVVGSNISNLALVLGAAALMAPLKIQGDLVRREIPLLLLATTAITVMVLDGPIEGEAALIGRSESIILFLLFGIFLYINVLDLLIIKPGDRLFADIQEATIVVSERVSRYRWLMVIAGCALLFIGGELTVRNAIVLAERFHLDPTIVGLFVVAIGTSMPELVTSIIAAMKDESDLALGNVIGSNICNSLIVLPVSGMITPIHLPAGGFVDLLVSLGLAIFLIPIFYYRKGQLGRRSGVILLLFYFAYAVWRVNQ